MSVHGSVIHNMLKVETAQMSMWMDKQNVVHMYNGILFVCKEEWNSDTYIHMYSHTYNMDEIWKYYAKWNKPDTKGQLFFIILLI